MALDYTSDPIYADERLRNSLIMLDGEPVMYQGQVQRSKVLVSYLKNGLGDEVPLKSLDLLPPKLGYVNRSRVKFACRVPSRGYRQGLRTDSLQEKDNSGRWGRGSIDLNLYKTIKGLFPSIQSCIDEVSNGEVVDRAFHRNWSVGMHRNSLRLYYKGRYVGKAGNDLTLNDEHFYLKESLEEAL